MYIHLVKSQTPQRNKCDSEIYILLCYFLTGRLVSSLKLWPRSWKSKVFPVVNWLTSGFVYATDCLWIANTCIPTRKGNTNQTSLKSFWPDIHFIICIFSHQDSEEKEFSSFVVQALKPAVCLVSWLCHCNGIKGRWITLLVMN